MMPIREIARELGTKYILEGSVRKYGNRVRIQTQLINAKGKQEVVWSQDFDRETTIDNILDIQSEVAQKVAFKLKANINPEVRKSIKNHATHNKLAYDLYLKGVQNTSLFWMSDSIEYVNIAMQYHLRALEIDSQFSLAYARLGECYWMLAHFSPNPSVSQWLESERALKKAIDLDPSNGLAYANYGVVQHNWKWDREGAEKSFEKAIQLMPGDIEVHFHAFVYYIRTGNCLKAAEELDQAQSLNPKTSKRNDNAWILLCQGKVTNLTHYSEKLKDIGTSDLVNLYLIEKQYKKAMNLAEIYYKKDDTFKLLYLTYYGVGAALAGEKEKASDIVSQLKEISTYRNVPDSFFAMIYFAMGNDNASYAYLEKALEDREFWIHFLKDTAPFYNHRNDQKFREIMTRSWIPLINSNMQN
jgi:adenylate cyclase